MPELPKPLGEGSEGETDDSIEALLHGPEEAADMEIERETVVEAAVSFAAVFVFIGAVVVVGMQFQTGPDKHLSATGGLAMLGAIGLFVVVMMLVGLWFARQE